MPNPYAVDPNVFSDVILVHASNTVTPANSAVKLPDGKRIDLGLYEFVLILVANCGGTATTPITIGLRESDTQAGPEFPLDGTNGAPDLSLASFATGVPGTAGNGSRQRVVRSAGRRRFLNVVVTVPASGTFRPCIYVVGYGKRSTSVNRQIETSLTLAGPLA